ncbi:hypothetical protein [Nonomuraea sp. NPDC050786]|uniref:hypothetical protein n=1 Tax=Nonomuraea sp. NPDC050786 TaxID=3154840 RepID=UPI0033F24A44
MTDVLDADAFSDPGTGTNGKRVVEFDGWGRYKLPDPDSGKLRSWTRVTTLAGTLEDTYNLERWGNRKVLEGIVQDRGLVSQAAEVFKEYGWDPQDSEAKKRLNTIVTSAQHVAGSKKGADLGTQLHELTEKLNQGDPALFVPAELVPNLRMYEATLQAEGITILPQYLERIVCIPEFNAVGRMDNISQETAAQVLRVFDLKTQKTMDFGALKIAIQLALYANASAMFNEDTWAWEDMPALDKSLATVCWLPVLEGQEDKVCHLYDVDLEWGWRWAKASFQTRKARGAKPVTRRAPRAVPAAKSPSWDLGSVVSTLAEAVADSAAGNGREEASVYSGAVADALAKSAASSGASALDGWGSVMLAASRAEKEPQIQAPEGLDWEARFRQARSIEELVMAGNACSAAGAMTPELKALGRTLRQELSTTTAG